MAVNEEFVAGSTADYWAGVVSSYEADPVLRELMPQFVGHQLVAHEAQLEPIDPTHI